MRVAELQLPKKYGPPINVKLLEEDADFVSLLYPGSKDGMITVQILDIDLRKKAGVIWVKAKVAGKTDTSRHRCDLEDGRVYTFIFGHDNGKCSVPDKPNKKDAA